jgi:hypothetical protein
MDALAYFAGCAAIFAATLGARFALARFIPATDDPSPLTHCMHAGHDDDGTGHHQQADCIDAWPTTTTTTRQEA